MRIDAIIGILVLLFIKSYGGIEGRASLKSSRGGGYTSSRNTVSTRPAFIEVREIILSERDSNYGVREITLGEGVVFEANQRKTQDLNFMWPLKEIAVTSNWGGRVDPITGSPGSKHNGIDLAAPIGTRVYSPESGIVRTARWVRGYGKTIIIDHGNGYSTRFAHLNNYNVKENDFVDRGGFIARTGNTGRSTGPHLHYEIRYEEQPLNPTNFLDL
ncbi:M23 family metallopeptidase [uncultured Ilyobacter sp.]|uniref:M23 family metallopeptidase n=1 Tax=uncultured Ilyobacter sp. TaxID=544433 RepID=UPI0029F4C6B3|nr:M23 family metallopeptidase [uncultured Ilyobacter sp.]